MSLRPLASGAFFLALCLNTACVSEDRTTVQTAGAWKIDRVKVSGWEQGYASFELTHNGNRVDRDVYIQEDYIRFFPPDCVIYRVKRVDAPFYAACGDRTPALLPSWVLSVSDRIIRGGTIVRAGRKIEEYAPIEEALNAARQQPVRTDDWQSTPQVAAALEKRLR